MIATKDQQLTNAHSPAWVVAKANEYARCHGLRQFVAYQGMWNAAVRDFERDIIPMCRDEGMALIPYAVVGGGKFQTAAALKERETNNPGRKGVPSDVYKAVSAKLEAVGEAKKASLHNIAIAYVMQKAPYVFPLVGTRTLKHLKDAVEALKVDLSAEDIHQIDQASGFDPGFPHTFLSGSQWGGEHFVPQGGKDVWLTNTMGKFDYVELPGPIKPQV